MSAVELNGEQDYAADSLKRFYIVDDDEMDRLSLQYVLTKANYETVIYKSGEEFVADISELAPGCVLLDVRMPRFTGIQVLEALSERRKDFAVIMVSGAADIPIAVRAMQRGAIDFLEKPCEPFKLVEAARHAGQVLRKQLHESRLNANDLELAKQLSRREKDVLKLLVKGFSSKDIGDQLGISPRTVDVHRARMMKRLDLKSSTELVRIAVRAGIDLDV